jgi:hypothetical protein
MDGWIDGWMDGWIDRVFFIPLFSRPGLIWDSHNPETSLACDCMVHEF